LRLFHPTLRCNTSQPKRYITSPLAIENALANPVKYPEWSKEQIQARHEEMLTWALQHWHVIPPACPVSPSSPPTADPWQQRLDIVQQHGVEASYLRLKEIAERLNLQLGLEEDCVVYHPPNDWRKSAITVYTYPGILSVGVRPQSFPTYTSVPPDQLKQILGDQTGWLWLNQDRWPTFFEKLEKLAQGVNPVGKE